MKIIPIIIFCLFYSSICSAQNTVKGVVLSKNGIPIPAYNVILEGTNIGTQTGICGDFEINLPEDFDGYIVISAITPQEWKIKTDKLKKNCYTTIILKSQRQDKNRNCKTKIKKQNVIKVL